MKIAVAIPVAGLVAGASVGLRWSGVPAVWLIALLCGCTLFACHAARLGRPPLVAVAAFSAFAVGGAALSANAWHRAWRPSLRIIFESIAHDARINAVLAGLHPPEDDSAPVVLTGVLRADASRTDSGAVSLVVDVEWVGRLDAGGSRTDPAANPVRGGVLLTVIGALGAAHAPEWRAGRRIRAPAELHRVARYLDPGVTDQERAMARRGISLAGTVKSAALVTVIGNGSALDELAALLRAYSRRAVNASVGHFSSRAAAIVSAIVIGDRTGLDNDVVRRLQEAGIYHVIAISGGNIALLAGLTLAVFRLAGVLGRAAMLSAATALIAYGFLVGGGASVNRAVLMAVVYFVGRAWDLRGPPLQALTVVAGILVLVDPLSIADPASLLTFGATAAIIAASPLIRPNALPPRTRSIAALLVASAAAEAALLPVAATFFSRVTFAGLLLNFGAIPLMALAQLAGMTVVPLYAVSATAARGAGWLAYVGAEGLVRTADLVAYVPWSTWRVAAPGLVPIVVYYGAILGAWFLWRSGRLAARVFPVRGVARARIALAFLAVGAGAWIVADPSTLVAAGDGRLHVTFIDVGQGDAAIVRLPRGSSMLIDAGGLPGTSSFDIGDRVVGPVLRSLGIRRLGTLAITHGDADHAGGAGSVLREFRPWDVWEGVPVPPLELLQRLRTDALAAGSRWTTVQRFDQWMLDEVRVSVLHPSLPDWERQDVRNADSVVIEMRWGEVSFVFTGDIDRETEAAIAPLLQPSPLRVLKVPHHGSSTSSSEGFVRAVRPDAAVISLGRSNNFGHPSPIVLKRYEQAGTRVFRTDQDGAITIDTDGSSLEISTFTGRTIRLRAG